MSNYNQAEFYFKRAETNRENDQNEKAIEFYSKVIALCADDVVTSEVFLESALLGRAWSYWVTEEDWKAIEDCSKIIETAPNKADAWALRGSSYASVGKKDEAIADLVIALEIKPKDTWILEQIIDFYLNVEEYQTALEYSLRLHKLQPNSPRTQFILGNIYIRLGDADNALSRYVHANGLVDYSGYRSPQLGGKEEAWIAAGYGAVSRLQGKMEDAIARLNQSMEIDDGLGWVWAERGEAYRQLGKYSEAISDFQHALDLDNSLSWINKPLQDCIRMAKLQMFELAAREGLEKYPNSPVAYHNLGKVLSLQDRVAEAISLYKKAIKKAPENISEICDELGVLLARQDNIPDHFLAYQQALKNDPQMGFVYYRNLGKLLDKRELAKDAEVAYRKAIELGPSQYEAYRELAFLLAKQERIQEQEALYKQAIEKCSVPMSAYAILGSILENQNHLEEAEKVYRQAVKIAPNSRDAYNSLGDFLLAQKRFQEAGEIYRKSIEVDVEGDYAAYRGLADALKGQNRHEEAEALMKDYWG